MKKSLLTLLGAGLLLTSCQSDEPFAPGEGGEKQVTFTLNVPGELGTRAGDSGKNSGVGGFTNKQGNVSYTLVLSAEGHNQTYKKENVAGNTVTFSPTVILGREYTVTAYAHFSATAQEDLKNIAVTKDFNDESKDVYFFTTSERASDPTIDFATEGTDHTFTLKRPFGKLRLVATDYQATGNGNTAIKSVKVKYNNNVFTTFNAVSGEFSNGQSYEHTLDGTNYSTSYYAPEKDENGDVIGQTIFADYIPVQLRGDHAAPFKITVEYQDGGTYTREFPQDIPVRRNALTTLKGNFFTAGAQITVEVDDDFEGGQIPGNDEEQLIIAAAMGGAYTLQGNIELSKPLNITTNMTLNLNGHTISAANAKGDGAVIEVAEGVSAKLMGGTIKNTTDNGDAAINSVGNLVLNGVHVEGAPLADGGHPEYAVYANGGTLVVEEGTKIESYRGAIRLANGADVTINGGEVKTTLSSGLTSHVVYAYGSNSKLTINNGEFTMNFAPANDSGASVICPAGATIDIYGGNFEFTGPKGQGGVFQNYMGYGAPVNVYGGVYNDATVNKNLAAGYKTIFADNLYYVLPETIADAASTANVTSVTESTTVLATAIATDNGEAAMFMWNDVAYIAKYGEVNIMASEEGEDNTTSRGVVENSTALTSATVAEGIEVVGERTFRKCANLETVTLPNTLTEIGPAVFQSCTALKNIVIPESVTVLGKGSFQECSSLESINIPTGVTRIESDCLRATGLKSVEFHAGVTYFGAQAFRDCKKLQEVVINAPEFTIEANAFGVMSGTYPGTTIYVVNADMKAYLESTLAYKNQLNIKLISEKQ